MEENLEEKTEEELTLVQKVKELVKNFYKDHISISGLPHEDDPCYRESDKYIGK